MRYPSILPPNLFMCQQRGARDKGPDEFADHMNKLVRNAIKISLSARANRGVGNTRVDASARVSHRRRQINN